MASEKLKLHEEEAAEAAQGKLPLHEVTPAVLLQVGLELEDNQRHLRLRSSSGRTVADLAENQEKRNVLMRRIELWRVSQDVHMPMVAELRASSQEGQDLGSSASPTKAEDIKLWLPSALPSDLASNELLSGLQAKERRLRLAQMADALADIRRIRRVLAAISEFQRLNIHGTGQRAVTRNLSLYDRFLTKQTRCAARYRDARSAMTRLEPSGAWTETYRPLLDADLRGPRREDDDVIPSEGRYEISWIWLTSAARPDQNTPASNAEFTETMRAEWARAKARVNRWEENQKLVIDEMRRVLAFLGTRATWWRQQASRRTGVSPRLRRGLAFYAEKQATIHEALATRTASFWVDYLKKIGSLPPWILPYEHVARKVRLKKWGHEPPEVELGEDSSSSDEEDD